MTTEMSRRTADVMTDPEPACPVSPVVEMEFSRWTTPILQRGPQFRVAAVDLVGSVKRPGR
ncbi:hypothetical protein OG780_28055 [Streptomyces sp. NBC_00386]|uniref:hypothetical protein n=1 Tax=Streptomyces sp. NBC_00386 TaxID=2975734 RepID=UPI002E1D8810